MTLPDGWLNKTLAGAAQVVMGQSPDSKYYSEEEVGLPFLQGCAEFQGRHPKHVIYCSHSKKIGCAGSILLSVRAPVGRLNVANRDYVIGRGLAALMGTRVTQEFLEHFLSFQEPRFRLASQGSTFEAINSSELNQWPILHPKDKAEQAKIAEVLSTVDRSIEQTEALIVKQQRIKTGLMQDLLTRGIDEHGNLRSEQTHKFKDSPLGRIPVEWDIATVDQIASITTGDKDTQDADPSAEYPFFVRSQTVEKISSYSFDGEAVLTAGDGVGTGKVFHYFNGRFDFHQRVYCIHSFTEDILGYYFFCHFQMHFMARVAQFSAKGSVDSVRRHMIAKMLVPKPGYDEQAQFVNILRSSATTLDDHTAALQKLRHLRVGLMHNLLTGERRVTALLGSPKELVNA